MKKLLTFVFAMTVSLALFAQTLPQKDTTDTPIPEELQAIRTASSLAMYGYKNESASALVEAAKIFNSIHPQEMVVREDSTPTREITPGSGVSFDPKQLIADAKEMAGRDKELTKYIQKVEKTLGKAKRGAIGGPVLKTSIVLTLSTDRYIVKFAGKRKANIILEATNEISDLDLYIYDEYENLVCYDNDASSECALSFTPRRDSYFIICVVNNGLLPNPYLLCTN